MGVKPSVKGIAVLSRSTNELSGFAIWMLAIRPKTLPAAAGPVVVGTALAIGEQVFALWPALAALLVALLLQTGSNLANDVFDFKKGVDTKERTGPLRVTQAGLLTPKQVLKGMWMVFALAGVLGLYLTWVGGWVLLVIGVAAIASAIAYTGGPFPIGYHGLGEVFVFIFFGPVAVCGTYYVQAGHISTAAWWASLPVGFLITAILVVNNFRDLHTDKKTGKKTMAVRLGATGTRWEYYLLLLATFMVPLVMWLQGITSAGVLGAWLALPFTWPLVRDMQTKKGRSLNETLAGTARLSLIFSILFSAGYLLGEFL